MVEEHLNDRHIDFEVALAYGVFTAMEGAFNFVIGGYIGKYGEIGTKGPFLKKEWYLKLIKSILLKSPISSLFDELYNSIGI